MKNKDIDEILRGFKKREKIHANLHKFSSTIFDPSRIIIFILVFLIIIILSCLSIKIMLELLSIVIVFVFGVLGLDSLSHSICRNMIEFLKHLKINWGDYNHLIARKHLLKSYLERNVGKNQVKKELAYVNLLISSSNHARNSKRAIGAEYFDYSCERLVSDFFEELGYALIRNVVDIEFVYEMYGEEIMLYHKILRNFIDEIQKKDNDAYSSFNFLNEICERYKALKP